MEFHPVVGCCLTEKVEVLHPDEKFRASERMDDGQGVNYTNFGGQQGLAEC